MFLAFQYPVEVPGVSVASFLRTALEAHGRKPDMWKLRDEMEGRLQDLGMDLSFSSRSLNEGFSGGEKKRNEVLQLMTLEPEFAILDETDSGLDIDAIKIVSRAIDEMRNPERGFLVITHYMRILGYLGPDVVHVLVNGRIVQTGPPELAEALEKSGYDEVRRSAAR
jgi:Fe-S cluster assembly ATP-binding protein